MFRPLLEQGKNRQTRFAETEESATARATGKLRERSPIFPRTPTAATFFVESAHKISECPGEMPFRISHAPFGDVPPIGVTSVGEMATRILVPIGSHISKDIYIGRYSCQAGKNQAQRGQRQISNRKVTEITEE